MNEVMLKVFELRYEGWVYKDIADKIKEEFQERAVVYGTINNNMAPNGIWFPLYQQYRNERNKQVFNEAMDILRKHARKAAEALVDAFTKALERNDIDTVTELGKLILFYSKAEGSKEDDNKDPDKLKGLGKDKFVELLKSNNIDPAAIFGNGSNKTQES